MKKKNCTCMHSIQPQAGPLAAKRRVREPPQPQPVRDSSSDEKTNTHARTQSHMDVQQNGQPDVSSTAHCPPPSQGTPWRVVMHRGSISSVVVVVVSVVVVVVAVVV
jgi:hypothetical protein